MPRESKTYPRGELPNYLADAAREFESHNPVDQPGLVVEEITVTYRYTIPGNPGRAVRQLERMLTGGRQLDGCLDRPIRNSIDDLD